MDASATQRFLDTNVQWPSNRFFIPNGRLPAFLQSNLRFKVFLAMMAVFPDAYATDTVRSLTTPQCDELRYRVRDIVHHMIRQNEFRISYEPPVIPSEAAWMFHIIQVLLVVVGFVGEDKPVVNIGEGPEETTDGRVAHAQAGFLLGAALSTFLARKKSGDEAHLDFPEYDANHWISANLAYRGRPTDFRPIATDDSLADTFKYNEIIARWREIGIGATARKHLCGHTAHTPVSCKASPPGIPSRSLHSLAAAGDAVMRVLAARMGEAQGPVDDFFVKEEERALSEASYGSMPGLVTPPASSASEKVFLVRGKRNKRADGAYDRPQGMEFVSIWPNDLLRVFLLRPSPNYIVFGVYRLTRSPGKCLWRGAGEIKERTAWVCPAVYLLQRCTIGEGGLQGPPVDIPPSEREELRLLALRLAGTVCFLSRVRMYLRVYHGLVETAPTLPLLLQDAPGISLENYRVPGCAANMMLIIMVLLGRLCDVEDRDRQAFSICSPILQEFRATAMAAAHLDHTDTEYPKFHQNGLLQELFYEIDLVPEDSALIVRGVHSSFRPLNPMPPATPKTGVCVCDKFLNCDFSTVGQMVDFAHHPFMAQVSREILEPLYQFFLHIREDFTWSPETKTKGEKRVMQQCVRDYLEMTGRLSDYVIRHHDLAKAKHIPMPRVAWLQVVMQADSVYGFKGDDNQLLRVILRGKIASLLQYSECLRQHVVDRIVEKDDEGTRTQRAFNPKSENLFYGLPGVIEEGEVEAMETLASTKFVHVEYVREHLRPFCELIRRCIPSAVTVPDDLPDGRAEFLRPYIGAYLEKAAFLYSATLEYAKTNIEVPFLDPSVIWSLTMVRTFHYMIGQPTYGYSRECCDAFLGRISSALSFADRTRTAASHTDVPLSVKIVSLPHVPSWTRDRINHLCILELNDAWTCENALLQDEIEASQGIGRGLEKAVAQAKAGYGQNPSGQFFV
ncbi:hypothetical protein B0H13DRAFT_1891549 [Mycena leptocephala]|nr:hypothetical protein B0H13DRAFT_1891549 [Mycena leptocephala]